MYIIKNALRCIGRAKGRNVLIGIIALVIAVSACIGLSIRQASESARKSALDGMSITATISYDRASAMGDMAGGRPGMGGGGFMGGSFDPSQFGDIMGKGSSLTLEEYQKYAQAESVQDFYYTLTAYFNGSDSFLPVSDETTDDSEDSDGTLDGSLDGEESNRPSRPNGMGGMMGGAFSSGDFSVIGYSSDSSMTAFINGNASIVDGSMFEEGTSELVCVISEELAMYNSLSVGDTISITNPSLDSETYTLTISGIYT
ncbi:MAG: ABC transporter permease, partial [Clostridia bacterium]|nr:ABC transporter permease [Clostridia bacterium]